MNAGDLVGGKYRLTQRLGAGAMGTVWAAVNERTGRKVALKLILHPTDDLRYRLLREARACGSLEHRNIVEIYDVGETTSGDPFLVMQLLTGETLADLVSRRRTLQPQPAAGIGRDIASALAAAHEAKIVHRDLKPANIFLYREGGKGDEDDFVLKVLDFGVSKNLAIGDGHATVTGIMVGSPAYMSPEQIRMAKDIDHRTDIWSLGIILYELLTGTRPFLGVTEEIIRQILTAPIPTVSSRVRHVPPELDAIVTQCLSRDRDKRYRDTKELARTLAAYAEGSQVARRMVSVPSAPGLDLPGSPTGTQLISPTDQIPSALPGWRRQVQQALAASRQAPSTPGSRLASEPPQPATSEDEDVTLLATAPAPYAKGMPVPALGVQPATEGKPPDALPGQVTGKAPADRGTAQLYAIIGAGLITIVALISTLVMRRGPPEAAPQPMSQPEAATVRTFEPSATLAPPTPTPTSPTALPTSEPTAAPLASPRKISPPPPTGPAPAVGNQLQPCSRFIKKNCR